ncbi:hypothetical protein DM47_1544 [Burkholderia mallei]|uniref:hypothetical protein n=1 Tax=Burkholderia mallei TaxID=13373 RepID=UPI0006C69198|nr:hypothetical protein [Burkholderia mallei]KOT17883.1 hypothetical protein DM47_1544 [Burkholderia mallei]
MICCSVKRFFMFVFFSENDFTRLRLALFVGAGHFVRMLLRLVSGLRCSFDYPLAANPQS